MLKFLCEPVLQTMGKYNRNRPAQSLDICGKAGTIIKLDTLNHVAVKRESKYCRYQHCGHQQYLNLSISWTCYFFLNGIFPSQLKVFLDIWIFELSLS